MVSFPLTATAPSKSSEDELRGDAPRVAVIVLNWRGSDDTIACVESVLHLENRNTGIFVCDNDSGDQSLSNIRRWASTDLSNLNDARRIACLPAFGFRDATAADYKASANSIYSVTLIDTGANLGYAGGNNVGLRAALDDGYDYCWILNNDVTVQPDALSWLLERVATDPAIGLCGSTLVYAHDPQVVQTLGGASFSRFKGKAAAIGQGLRLTQPIDAESVEQRLSFVNGAATLVSRALLEQIGPMQEDYFLYWEEADWAMRARRRFRLGYAARSVVHHKVGASIGTNDFGKSSPLSDYYNNRNRVRFCFRFAKLALPFVVADMTRSILRYCRTGSWSRALLLLRATLGLPYRPIAAVEEPVG